MNHGLRCKMQNYKTLGEENSRRRKSLGSRVRNAKCQKHEPHREKLINQTSKKSKPFVL